MCPIVVYNTSIIKIIIWRKIMELTEKQISQLETEVKEKLGPRWEIRKPRLITNATTFQPIVYVQIYMPTSPSDFEGDFKE